MRIHLLPSLILLATCSGNLAAECRLSPDFIGAEYTITRQTSGQPAETHSFALWRAGQRVAHEYSQAHITDVWHLMPNDKIHLVRNFDNAKRGIEYQPVDMHYEGGKSDWSLKNQLVSDSLLKSLTTVDASGSGCERQIHYRSGKHQQTSVQLSWLPALQLVKSYREHDGQTVISWELQNLVSAPTRIDQQFTRRENYQTTDFIDIGDNESDPFLQRMIHLGFIEHGASGFYDQAGNPVGQHAD